MNQKLPLHLVYSGKGMTYFVSLQSFLEFLL